MDFGSWSAYDFSSVAAFGTSAIALLVALWLTYWRRRKKPDMFSLGFTEVVTFLWMLALVQNKLIRIWRTGQVASVINLHPSLTVQLSNWIEAAISVLWVFALLKDKRVLVPVSVDSQGEHERRETVRREADRIMRARLAELEQRQ